MMAPVFCTSGLSSTFCRFQALSWMSERVVSFAEVLLELANSQMVGLLLQPLCLSQIMKTSDSPEVRLSF